LHSRIKEKSDLQILDVRRPAEYQSGHIPGAISAELAHLEEQVGQLDPERPTAVACAGGYRSSAAASLLQRKGFRDLYNVVGGTSAWTGAGYEAEIPAANA
jgi:hydroxyacylglutathione hydrolase